MSAYRGTVCLKFVSFFICSRLMFLYIAQVPGVHVLNQPAFSATGEYLVVAGVLADAVYVLDPKNGHLVRSIGSSGSAPLEFGAPSGVCVTRDNGIIVADFQNSRLQEIANLGRDGDVRVLGDELLWKPVAVSLTAEEDALIVLEDLRRILVLTRDATCVLRVLLDVAGLPELRISSFAVCNDVVAAARVDTVVLLDVHGKWKRNVSGEPLSDLTGTAVDCRGHVWVTLGDRFLAILSQCGGVA